MQLTLQKFGNPILRQVAEEVKVFNQDLKTLADKMLEIMYQSQGIGLAADQAGRLERIFVLDIPPTADMSKH